MPRWRVCSSSVLMALTLLPFLSMFTAALAPSGSYPPGLAWPADPQWSNFAKAFEVAKMDQLLLSSALIVLGTVPLSVLFATMAGYGLAKFDKGRGRFLYLVFVLGLTLPFEAVITPLYYEIKALGVLNTRFAIILPLIGLYMPFGVYWMRTHFVNTPKELSEAAQIDGASEWKQFWLVHVPLARPAIMSLAILQFLWTWNQFLLPRGAGAGSAAAHHGRRPRRLPGPVGHRYPAALRRRAADPRPPPSPSS